MSNQSNLDQLHALINAETAKLVKWEVETEVNIRDKEGQLHETAAVAAAQEKLIPQLKARQNVLREEMSTAVNKREELNQKVNFTQKEVDVLCSQFTSMVVDMESIRAT